MDFGGSALFTFENPNLQVAKNENTYKLTGEVKKYTGTPDISELGFVPATDNVFVLKLTVDNVEESATVRLVGEHSAKDFTKANFDGANYVYLVLDGNTVQYVVTVKAAENVEPVELIIDNQATMEA